MRKSLSNCNAVTIIEGVFMNTISAILGAYILYRCIFSSPFDLPVSFIELIGGESGDLDSDNDRFEVTFIKCIITLALFYILGLLQGAITAAVMPERAMEINELSQTILSGGDFNLVFAIWKIIFYGFMGGVSIEGFFITILINLAYIIVLTALAYFLRVLADVRIPYISFKAIAPLNTVLFFVLTILLFTMYNLKVQTTSVGFFKDILTNVWSLIDKVRLTSAMGAIIGASTTNVVIKTIIIIVTKGSNISNIDSFK